MALFGAATAHGLPQLEAAAAAAAAAAGDSRGGGAASVDMESFFSRLSLDIIGKSVFDYDFDSLRHDDPVIQVGWGSASQNVVVGGLGQVCVAGALAWAAVRPPLMGTACCTRRNGCVPPARRAAFWRPATAVVAFADVHTREFLQPAPQPSHNRPTTAPPGRVLCTAGVHSALHCALPL